MSTPLPPQADLPGASSRPKDPAKRLNGLDGLRTIAVFLVILFHVQAPGFTTGYLGVDLFFVLSGYLITTGLVRELRRGRIDSVGFWSRRFRRLMPAALLVLVTVLVAAYTVLPVYRRPSLGGDLWATLLYIANWRMMQANSYFAASDSVSPLLHMWSLAVEEQFYLAWPLCILAVAGLFRLRRRPERARAATITLLGLSAVAVVGSAWLLMHLYNASNPDRAYMGTDTKAFEPMLGAFAAVALSSHRVQSLVRRWSSWLIYAGALGFVGVLVLLQRPEGIAPRYFSGGALAFCLACLALILGVAWNADRSLGARLLGVEPVAYLGRISYGLYLWHWPLAVWLGAAHSFTAWRAAAAIALTIVVSAASYHLVEMPVRTGAIGRALRGWRTIAAAAATTALLLVPTAFLGGTVVSRPLFAQVYGESDVDPATVLLLGDSVPQRMERSIVLAGEAQQRTMLSATAGGCSPMPIAVTAPGFERASRGCVDHHTAIEEAMLSGRPGTIIWWSRAELMDITVDGRVLTAGSPQWWDTMRPRMETEITQLTRHGATLVLVDIERPGREISRLCTPQHCHPTHAKLLDHTNLRTEWNAYLHTLPGRFERVRVISMDDWLCHDGNNPCDDSLNGAPARHDGSHLAAAAAGPAAKELMKRVLTAAG